ncbi:TRL-like family protein [Thiotrichales bacterium 19S3-7]|nr:TRL-like family protein [Thiotrichales bacterium 19S3-7]MCF6802200.1 TRL-like family protein [Thiotrichales bacterium 19S3-11]
MIKQLIFTSVIATSVLLTGCASYLPMGQIYTGVHGAPVSGQIDPNVSPAKEGQACSISILGLVAVGDMTVESAAKEGGIAQVASVSYNSQNILGVYGKYCTVVRGS